MADLPSEHEDAEQSLRKILAGNLARRRLAKGWSQQELADRTGIDRTYIAHVERGVKNVGLDNLERLAAGLKVAAHKLLVPPR